MKASVFAFVVFLFAAVSNPALAVSVSIISLPANINQDPFTITASISGASSGTNYLRVDIFKDGSDNYFGQTYNGSSWYQGSTYTQYLPITIQSGTDWSGSIQGQTGSPTLSEYDGAGTYKIRLRRYTGSGGTNATEANNSSVVVSVNIPTPTSTPAPPTATPKPVPTATPKPVPTATPITIKITSSPKVTTKVVPKSSPQVLGDKTKDQALELSPTVEVLSDSEGPNKADGNFIPKVFISIGIVFLLLCGIVIFYPVIKKIKDKDVNE